MRNDTRRIHTRTVDIRLNYGNKWRKEEDERGRSRIRQKEERMGSVEGGSSVAVPLFHSDIMLILFY